MFLHTTCISHVLLCTNCFVKCSGCKFNQGKHNFCALRIYSIYFLKSGFWSINPLFCIYFLALVKQFFYFYFLYSSFSLVIHFTCSINSVYMSISQFIPSSSFPLLVSTNFSLCICLYFCQQAFIYCVTWLIQEVEDSVEIQFTISLRVHHIETVVDTWLRRFMGLLEHQEKNRCE